MTGAKATGPRAVALVLLALLTLVPFAAPAAATSAAPSVASTAAVPPTATPGASSAVDPAVAGPLPAPESVVVVGAPGLAWTDVDPAVMPTVRALADDGAVAAMTVRAVRSRSCAVDGWLTLSSGRRAADLPGPCRTPTAEPVGGAVPQWVDYVVAARQASYGARPGLLGESLDAAGVCVEAVGPGAAIGAADEGGDLSVYGATVPGSFGCAVTLVDGGVLPEEAGPRAEAAARLDALVADVVAAAGTDTRVVVAGVGDGDSPIRPRALVVGGTGPALLTSSSTRQEGLVQLQDLTATLLGWYAADDGGVSGRPLRVVPDDASAAERIDDAAGLEVRAGTLRSVSPQVTGWLAAAFALWCAVVVGLRWGARGRTPLPRGVGAAGVAVASVPAATFVANLVPWWGTGRPGTVFTVVLAAVVAAVTTAAVLAGRRVALGATTVVASVGLAVLLADVLTGSRLQLASVFGQNPTVGGRFYGFGNTSFAVYGAAVLVVVHALATTRRLPRAVSLAAGSALLVVALAVEAHPSLGADFGGPPGLLLGGVVVLAAAAGLRLTPVRLLLAALAAGLLTVGVAVLDWSRAPGARTHLGDFVQTVLDGDAGTVVGRKIAQNLANLGVPALVVVAVATLAVAVVLWRTGWRPAPGGGVLLRAAAVMGVVAFAINDSGLVIPAFVAVVLLPTLVADTRHAAEEPAAARR